MVIDEGTRLKASRKRSLIIVRVADLDVVVRHVENINHAKAIEQEVDNPAITVHTVADPGRITVDARAKHEMVTAIDQDVEAEESVDSLVSKCIEGLALLVAAEPHTAHIANIKAENVAVIPNHLLVGDVNSNPISRHRAQSQIDAGCTTVR